jgi:D-alanyl-lipoteichoic acid acyltransferase DltB (MBOAT superfamily)
MLFNSPEFIFLFLPIAVTLHFLAARRSPELACAVTTVLSFVFYLWWNPPFVVLPLFSVLLNFALAIQLAAAAEPTKQRCLILGICANLMVLIYFKYANFLLSIVSNAAPAPDKVPLALSFTTFVQIAFLLDVYRRPQAVPFNRYAMFVAFFPHLIAGPIVRWGELGPQIEDGKRYRVDWANVALGLTIFTFGLAKKVRYRRPPRRLRRSGVRRRRPW